jgi:Xaa-Pro aminopeptidase
MKKHLFLVLTLTILSGCTHPGGRSWQIPITIDPSDLAYNPAVMGSFEGRRQQVMNLLDNNSYVIVRSSSQCSSNRHEFRPNNFFYYLTGYTDQGSYALLSSSSQSSYTLSAPPRNIRMEIYNGKVMDEQEIKELYHPDQTVSYQEVRALIDSIVKTGAIIYMDRSDRTFLQDLQEMAGDTPGSQFRHIGELLDELRVIKEPMEVEFMQKACNITARALTNVMRDCQPNMYEFEMEAVIEGTFLEYGSAMPGFNSIVGSGPNSTTLHYEPNSGLMKDGDLLLMDIGAEYGYYTADITRTIPVNGKFTEEQRSIYELVLEAQKAAIELMVPGRKFNDSNDTIKAVISRGLADLGLITDPGSTWQIMFYMLHGTSHFLGLDVHDVGEYYDRVLEPGMVITIEPGIYFRENALEQAQEMFQNEADSMEISAFVKQIAPVYEQYVNIGVRIEDDILVTAGGNINLSRYAPKEIEDIEQIMN